ncbi:exosome complex component RRP45 [Bombyx mori]|uniref:Exosome complex component RRP45 n=1 Tax=Bombyx mori TaxID=7091 RepID=A0A8R2QWL8_BOMMO|nr:exosome complex component RRP45 [Bombyx mori]
MRDTCLSNCEKNFIQKIVSQGHRLDGRNFNETRKLDISFGSEYGCCIVSLGETKILSEVTCEVAQPKQIRPNEGIIFINVELNPMAAPQFEANRQTDLTVYLVRLLEKCYKDSKCIDLESLCIVVEEKVWSLRINIKVLNHDGNLTECASIATLASIAHFRRPDFTRDGDRVIIHTLTEKDPIPTVLYHYPVCTTFALYSNDILLTDPNFLEESVCTSNTEEGINTAGGLLVLGMNQYREVCLLDLTGAAIYTSNIVHKALLSAADKCKKYVEIIKNAVAKDDNLRQKREKINFSDIITTEHMLALSRKDLNIQLKHYDVTELDEKDEEMFSDEDDIKPEPSKYDVVATVPNTAELKSKEGKSEWIEVSSDSGED